MLSDNFRRVDNLLVLLRADVDYNENVMEAECVLEHSLRLCESLDLTDEFGRRRLCGAVREWLVSPQVPAILTHPLLQLFFSLESSVVSLYLFFLIIWSLSVLLHPFRQLGGVMLLVHVGVFDLIQLCPVLYRLL